LAKVFSLLIELRLNVRRRLSDPSVIPTLHLHCRRRILHRHGRCLHLLLLLLTPLLLLLLLKACCVSALFGQLLLLLLVKAGCISAFLGQLPLDLKKPGLSLLGCCQPLCFSSFHGQLSFMQLSFCSQTSSFSSCLSFLQLLLPRN
jgi:hypothetical protein